VGWPSPVALWRAGLLVALAVSLVLGFAAIRRLDFAQHRALSTS
jgi:hypothetical protein